MQPAVAAKWYEKNAWVLLTILGAIAAIFSFLEIAGIPDDPACCLYSNSLELFYGRIMGYEMLGIAILGMAISMTAYKKGEKWVWYVTWYFPIYLIVMTVDTYLQGGANWPLYIIFMLVSLAALLLPYRIFFPKK